MMGAAQRSLRSVGLVGNDPRDRLQRLLERRQADRAEREPDRVRYVRRRRERMRGRNGDLLAPQGHGDRVRAHFPIAGRLRAATLMLSVVAIGFGILFEHVNVAFLVGLVAAVAASADFPVLVSSIFWRGMTTRGAVVGGGLGLVSAVFLTLFSRSVWVDVLHQAHALVPLDNPAVISVPLAFAGIWIFSMLDRGAGAQREREAFAMQEFYGQTGLLPMKAVDH